MQRLIHRLTRRGKDRGATVILVALSLVVLVGFTALAVDVGALWSDKKQLQNGADAGALAIAQSCAQGSCGDVNTSAATFAAANKLDGNATGTAVVSGNTVTVSTTSTRALWFAPVFGIDTADVPAQASARWGIQSGGQFLPLTFSKCAFVEAGGSVDESTVGTEMTLYLKAKETGNNGSPDNPAPSPSTTPSATATTYPGVGGEFVVPECPPTGAVENSIPGGFGWLETDGGTCLTSLAVGDVVDSDPGVSESGGCLNPEMLQNQVVPIPIFDTCLVGPNGDCQGGAGGEYHIWALAAFRVTEYCLPNSGGAALSWALDGAAGACNAGMGPNGYRIKGIFQNFANTATGDSDGTAPDAGLEHVALIN